MEARRLRVCDASRTRLWFFGLLMCGATGFLLPPTSGRPGQALFAKNDKPSKSSSRADHTTEPVMNPRRGRRQKDIEGIQADILEQLISSLDKESLSQNTLDSVLRVYCTHVQPSLGQPWQKIPQVSSTSSGFVIDGRRIITNAHSVEYGSIIQLRKRGDDTKWVAELLAYGPECDLAVLTVKDDKFWEGVEPLSFGKLPALLDDVSVVGYPIGGESLSVTAGVVSRIELQEYAQGGETLLAIQIDAAINSGNSGGPVINDDDEVVGVAFQTLSAHDTENIGYVIPVDVVLHFLEDISRHGSYTGFCSLGVAFQTMESPSLRKHKNLPEGMSGVLITKTHPLAPASQVLKSGDVLVGVDDIVLANDGTIPFRKGERVELHYYFQQLYKGDSVNLKVYRDSQMMEVSVPVYIHKHSVRHHLNNEDPGFLMVGGLVFSVLSHPFLEATEAYTPQTPADVRLLLLMQASIQHPAQQGVVLTEILEHEVNLGYEVFGRQQIVSFNGAPILNLAHLAQMVDDCSEGEMVFKMDRGEIIVLDAPAAHRATGEIAFRHGLPSSRSPNLASLPGDIPTGISHLKAY